MFVVKSPDKSYLHKYKSLCTKRCVLSEVNNIGRLHNPRVRRDNHFQMKSLREPAFFPIITMGKYEKNGNRIDMPVNITIAHAVADGYHIGLFFEYLQNEINALKN